MNKFNVSRFRELLKKEKVIKKSRKSLLYESPEDYLELVLSRTKIRDEWYYQNRFNYASLIQDFLKGKIGQREFHWELSEMDSKDRNCLIPLLYLDNKDMLICLDGHHRKVFDPLQQKKDLEKLFAVAVTHQSKGFSDVIHQIQLSDISWFSNKSDFAEELREELSKIFANIQHYLTP